MGKKTQQNFLSIYVWKVQRQDPKQVLILPANLSLSPMCYTQVSVCFNEEHNSSIYTVSVTLLLP